MPGGGGGGIRGFGIILFKLNSRKLHTLIIGFRVPTLKTKELHVYSPTDKTQFSSVILFIGEETCSYLEETLSELISLGLNVELVLWHCR